MGDALYLCVWRGSRGGREAEAAGGAERRDGEKDETGMCVPGTKAPHIIPNIDTQHLTPNM